MDEQGTMVTLYGLMGHAGRLRLPLRTLEIEDLEQGEEFVYQGRVYQIRSVFEQGEETVINVTLALHEAIF